MLNLNGSPWINCDGIPRRTFLRAGAMGFAGLTLADLLRAEAQAGIGSSNKAIINIHLDGGPPQMDMIDLKPEAPSEIRGEFSPVATSLTGFQVCELMPKLAQCANQFTFIRSLVGSAGRHDAFQNQSGFGTADLQSIGGRPAVGCVLSRLLGTPQDETPTFVDLMQGRPLVRNSARPGFLGPSHAAFRPDISKLFHRELESGMKNELARLGGDHSTSLSLIPELTVDRLNVRTSLLQGLDRVRRQVDASGMMDAMDRFTQQAVGILTSGRFAEAMDFDREDAKTVERYTPRVAEVPERFVTAEGPRAALKLLMARRLVEAGVRCVSVSFSDFDTHSKNFPRMRDLLPIVDHGLWALTTDLQERGLLDDVSIVIWGEFGRTPRIDTKTGGRHHWPAVAPAILVGGGMKVGQVIGSTDRTAGQALTRPVTHQDIFTTLYHNLGIDAHNTTIDDPHGRPQYLLSSGEVIRELV